MGLEIVRTIPFGFCEHLREFHSAKIFNKTTFFDVSHPTGKSFAKPPSGARLSTGNNDRRQFRGCFHGYIVTFAE